MEKVKKELNFICQKLDTTLVLGHFTESSISLPASHYNKANADE
jgi:hypothetical protein